MALPNPLPDNPLRWDGWKKYASDNFYDRLCLNFDGNASADQIEDHCRQLLVWWQKKLPLKNQPSNPMAQMLRGGMDEAPVLLAEARTELLNPVSRARIDAQLHGQAVLAAVEEFKKILSFALVDNGLLPSAEERLYHVGTGLGLTREETKAAIDGELERVGAVRVAAEASSSPPAPPAVLPLAPATAATDNVSEFRRMLRLSRLCLDGGEMTDDQRDALCNMGESLGLSGGEAEDIIDEYLEEAAGMPVPLVPPARGPAPVRSAAPPARPVTAPAPQPKEAVINTSPLARGQERQTYPNFICSVGAEMFLVTSGILAMGSDAPDATPQEQPVTPVTVGCFYLARFPVTNAQYEKCDPSHAAKRAPWADDAHPVIYVSSREAEKFCQWLSMREGRRYRLPTEAEWEYAARGTEGRAYPWGERFDAGIYANFADCRTPFAWRDATIDDGFAQTAPVGSYPRGASPFGLEDMAGNVFEWCLDFFEPYTGKPRVNRRGSSQGARRNYRGGSWKSRASSLRATTRHFNLPDYSSNDVGFRILCEVE